MTNAVGIKFVVVQRTGFASYYLGKSNSFHTLRELAEVFPSRAAARAKISAFLRNLKHAPVISPEIEVVA